MYCSLLLYDCRKLIIITEHGRHLSVLVEAIKVQQAQIEKLREQNEALTTRIEALEDR